MVYQMKGVKIMKKSLFLVVVALLITVSAFAVDFKDIKFGANAVAAIPTGTFGDVASFGIGITGQAELPFSPEITGTFSIGYISFGSKDYGLGEDFEASWSCIPIKAGAKYFFDENFYGVAEIGIYAFSSTVKADMGEFGSYEASASSSEFGFAPGVGYQMPVGENMKLDLSVQYEIAGDCNYLGFDIGIRF